MVSNGDTNRLQLWIYLGDGRGNFTRAPETRIDTPLWGLGIGDLNGDGAPDLAFLSYDRSVSSNYLQLLLGRGDGTFTLGGRVTTSSDFNAAPKVADVNRDGKMDVALFVGGMLTVYRGDGAGNLSALGAWQMAPYVLQQLDLNHDGLLDAVAGEQGRIRIALGTTTGFAPSTMIELEGFSNWASLVLADINLDENLDAIGSAGFILPGRGDGTFGAQEDFLWDAQALFIADFTRDGLPDIIVPTTDGAFDVLVNRRTSVNHAPTVDAGPDVELEYTSQFPEEPPGLFATGKDEDQHWLTYEWRDEHGRVVGFDSPYLSLDYPFSEPPPRTFLSHGTHTFTVTVRDGRGASATDAIRVTIVPTKEIVLWAASGFYDGTFEELEDSTAAGGVRGHDRNLRRAKVTTPSTNPPNRITLGFLADPTQTTSSGSG